MSQLKTRLLFTPVFALLLFSATRVGAANISWTYSSATAASKLFGDSGSSGGYINFAPGSSGSPISGTSDIVVANLSTVSGASPNLPDQFVGTGVYSLTLTITDTAAQLAGTVPSSGSLIFSGKFGGTFSDGNANVTNQFTGQLTQQLLLGLNLYTVTIGGINGNSGYTAPGPPDQSVSDTGTPAPTGSIGAHVDVQPADVVVTKNAPEPSSMVLSIFGLSAVGASWWRKRRAAAA